jgi:hypothetical protein
LQKIFLLSNSLSVFLESGTQGPSGTLSLVDSTPNFRINADSYGMSAAMSAMSAVAVPPPYRCLRKVASIWKKKKTR